MRLFGVMGHPVLHSRSPQIFGRLFSSRGVDAVYTRVVARTAEEALSLARRMGMAGLNVTSPFKEAICRLAAACDEQASRLGAANTVVLGADTITAFNTDPDGVRHALAVAGISAAGSRVVVLGAGGAARAAAHALVAGGADGVVTRRSASRAVEAASGIGCGWADLAELPGLLASATGLVSCLPADADVVEEHWLHPQLWVLDANYHHAALAETARRRGCVVLDGLDWLIGQAAETYRVFVGQRPVAGEGSRGLDVQAAAEIGPLPVAPADGSADRGGLALAGMMGAGKTAAGREIARRLGRDFIDTDEVIVERTGREIPWLFVHRSEEEFRRIEADAIARVLDGRARVIALGGGSLEHAATLARVRSSCRVVWLWASPACLAERTAPDGRGRPLLEGAEGVARLAALLSARTRAYASAADLVADAERPLGDVVDLIEFEIRRIHDAALARERVARGGAAR